MSAMCLTERWKGIIKRVSVELLYEWKRIKSGIWFAISVFINVAPAYSLLLFVGNTFLSFVTPIEVYLLGLIVDGVSSSVVPQTRLDGALVPTVALILIRLLIVGANPFLTLVTGIVNDRATSRVNEMIIRKGIQIVGIDRFERSSFYNEIQVVANRAGWLPMNALSFFTSSGRQLTMTIGFLILLNQLSPLLGLLMIVSWLPLAIQVNRHRRLVWEMNDDLEEHRRRANYWRDMALDQSAAKEARVFNLVDWFKAKYLRLFRRVEGEFWQLRRKLIFHSTLAGGLAFVGVAVALGYVIRLGLLGSRSAGEIVFFMGSILALRNSLEGCIASFSQIVGIGDSITSIQRFLDSPEDLPQPVAEKARRPKRGFGTGIELRDVWFRYPGTEKDVLKGLSMKLVPGKTVAIVGMNGHGKTTIVKLLSRFYDPSEGQVLLDGYDLREYDILEVRKKIAVMFQDFGRYAVALKENIGFGSLSKVDNSAKIVSAAIDGGSSLLAKTLHSGFETRLGSSFGGADLSTGEWQKVAMSRAVIRDADLLILDEPTASLDVNAESDFIERFTRISRNKMVLLISHRFSTIRLADHIVVLDRGRILEEGNHSDLIQHGGKYAHLYGLQAAGYRFSNDYLNEEAK